MAKKSPWEAVVRPKCPWHRPPQKLPYYYSSFEDAERRHAKGQEQIQCPDCLYWLWPDEFGSRRKTND